MGVRQKEQELASFHRMGAKISTSHFGKFIPFGKRHSKREDARTYIFRAIITISIIKILLFCY